MPEASLQYDTASNQSCRMLAVLLLKIGLLSGRVVHACNADTCRWRLETELEPWPCNF